VTGRVIWCAACKRRHLVQAVVPDFPKPSWRDHLRTSAKLIVGIAFVYAFAIVYFAAAYR
jgi:hypothetical protein